MIHAIQDYFDKLFCVWMPSRPDRREHAEAMFRGIGIDPLDVEWFEGYHKPVFDGRPQGHAGCTSSHAALYHIIAHQKIPRALIFEDDADIAFTGPDMRRRVDPQALFESYLPELPTRWDMLFLGRHFAEMPQARRSPHVIKIGRMLTTSTYGITCEFARKIAPYIFGVGPIDVLLGQWQRENECYCVDPTLFVQYTSKSDITDEVNKNAIPMQDMHHLQALDRGEVYPPPGK